MFRGVLVKGLSFVALFTLLLFVADEPAYAIKSIPDGGMTSEKWSGLEEASKVDPYIERMWKNKQIPRGGKDPALYSPTKGSNLIYDVYAGTSSQVKKRGFYVVTNDNVITFDGWAIIRGHHHHAKQNQATYIGLVNKENSSDRMIFKTYMRGNTNANDELWYKDPDRDNSCGKNDYNKAPPAKANDKGKCNMHYNYTQFRAYIDARKVFGGNNEGKEWEMYIIKRVEDKVVYAPLILPFDTEEFTWKDGKVTLKSGEDARALRMVNHSVVKRDNWDAPAPPASDVWGTPRWDYRYFAPSKEYRMNGVNDGATNQVTVQYRVFDNVTATVNGERYRATNKNKWASSAFWEFGGSIATLSYKKTHATVTINHVDKKTNKILKTETVRRKLNETYTRSPYTKGNLMDDNGREIKDNDGFSYVANPSRAEQQFSEVIKGNRTIRFDYQASVDVTINHIDAKTNAVLDKEKFKRQYNDRYTVSPKTKGTYKDEDGNSYVASPPQVEQQFSEVLKDDVHIDFYYKADLPDPTEEFELPNTTDGQVEGKALWELRKVADNDENALYVEMNFVPSGIHYEYRNEKHIMKLGDYERVESKQPIALTGDPSYTKNKDMQYDFLYEYTNFYRDNYKCVDEQEGNCFEWEFVDRTPVWEKGETFSLADKVKVGEKFVVLKMDHRYGDTVSKSFVDDIITEKFLVGKGDGYKDNKRENTAYYEQFEKLSNDMKWDNNLKTQSSLNIKPDAMEYRVSVPSGEHRGNGYQVLRKGLVSGLYFPVDVDDSLKDDLTNYSNYDLGDYAIFLQQSEMKDKGLRNNERVYEMDFVTDYFFISEHTGFMVNYPFAYQLNRHFMYGDVKPVHNQIISMTNNKMSQDFFKQTGQEFKENIIGIENGLIDVEKVERYYLPVSPTSELEPNEEYTNKVVLDHLGLNNLKWEYEQKFMFEYYLFGSGHDDAWIIEQVESKIDGFSNSDINRIVIKHENKQKIVDLAKERPDERLHEFRVIDRDFVDKIKGVVGGF